MTDAQIDARQRAFQLLTEHFNAVVVITQNDLDGDKNETEEDRCEEVHHMHDGGHSTATGMVYKTLRRLTRDKRQEE